jgi:hypothetical protein
LKNSRSCGLWHRWRSSYCQRPARRRRKPKLFQQILHLVGFVAGHGQVVRAQRAGDAVDLPATAVAAGAVFELQHHEIVDAALAQRPRRGQAGHAAAGDQRMDAAGGTGRTCRQALAGGHLSGPRRAR